MLKDMVSIARCPMCGRWVDAEKMRKHLIKHYDDGLLKIPTEGVASA